MGESAATSREAERARGPETTYRPGFLELFFDLLFVVALVALTNRLAGHLSWLGAAQTFVLFLAFTLLWVFVAWGAHLFDLNSVRGQVPFIPLMIGTIVMSVAVPGAFEGRGLLFAIAYSSVQLGVRTGNLLTKSDRGIQLRARANIFWLSISGLAWFAGAFLSGPARLVLWAVAVAVEYAAVVLNWATPGIGRAAGRAWHLLGERVSERYRQFLVIAFGVTILVAGLALRGEGFTTAQAVAFVVAFVETVLMWRIYIHRAGQMLSRAISESANPTRFTQLEGLVHLVMAAGTLLVAVADQLVVRRPYGETPTAWSAVILGGPAVFLVGRALLDFTVFSRVSWFRLGGVILLVAAVPAAPLLPPLGLVAVTVVILFGVALGGALTSEIAPKPPTN